MKLALITLTLLVLCSFEVESAEITIPYSTITAPVVHSGKYHLLSCGNTYVVLDGSRGMSISMIGHGPLTERGADTTHAVLKNAGLMACIISDDDTVETFQTFDPSARLQIIDQGPGRVAARVYFSLCSADGYPHGSGTLDLYVYSGHVYLAPSLHIDDKKGKTYITKAGFFSGIPGNNAELFVKGSKLLPMESVRFVPFGEETENFNISVNNPGRSSVKIGWLRNSNPDWLYLRNIAGNPEVDELYEKWPPWITQRGAPLAWTATPRSGLFADYSQNALNQLNFMWVNGDSLDVPEGGYKALNGIMAIFLAPNALEVHNLWTGHEKPVKPDIKEGEFKYYNEIEGVYEIDSLGGDIDVTFDSFPNIKTQPVFVRIWNLEGCGAYEIEVDNKSVPFGLFNDGDIIEDPMVSIVKEAAGPARYATAAFTLEDGMKSRLTMRCKSGIQLTYQMYSDLETCEAWSDACGESPLFRFHLRKGALYHATLPGKKDYAFFKLPLFWLKNGVNENTFMNNTRGFVIHTNGPDRLQFSYTGVNLQGTGLSKFTATIPYERDCLSIDVTAEFMPLDDGKRWTSVEYCDLYPFEHVYRRDFHYDDVYFLDRNGVFDKVGTGAWSGGFKTVEEPERLGYYAENVTKEGPGTRTPDSSDGTVWILGNNTNRGNILYRRRDWPSSPGAISIFSLCNAWVDIHNTISKRQSQASGE
ncbi:MAG: hypothetical protein HOC71_01620, partial [Candidatus Latescibacteria bacterium]|nr:hypothetical protein [Candidatus Latescibacterota bacterium]